jgi:cytochrome c oxidase subunit IV
MEPMMFAVLSVACATATGYGLARLTVWAIIPASIILMMIAVVLGVYLDLPWGRLAIIAFAVLPLLQVSYLISAVLSEAPAHYWISGPMPQKQQLLHTMQASIGGQLQTYFKAPVDGMPPRMRNRLARLDAR